MEWAVVLIVVMTSWVITSVEGGLEPAAAFRIGSAAAASYRSRNKM